SPGAACRYSTRGRRRRRQFRSAAAACSAARDGHVVDEDRAAALRAAHDDVAADRSDAAIHVLEIARHGDLLDRKGDLAVLDPVTGRAARIVAGDEVYAVAERLGDEEAAAEVFQHAHEVWPGRREHEVVVAACVAGALHAELARRIAAEEVALE